VDCNDVVENSGLCPSDFELDGENYAIAFFLETAHCGFIFCLDSVVYQADLLRDKHLRYCTAPVGEVYFCTKANLSIQDQEVFAVILKGICEDPDSLIRYGIGFPEEVHFKQGKYVGNEDHQGLTCSTFIVSVMQDHGYSILDPETWPVTDLDDILEKDRIVADLKASAKITDERASAQAQLVGISPRIRPSDAVIAAGACTGPDSPSTFEQVRPAAEKLETTLNEALESADGCL